MSGQEIEELWIQFENGRVNNFNAKRGEKAFRELVETDDGADRLGEIALVGIDSPIFQSGRVFHEILFDENAACHMAFGEGYPACIEGGTEMSEKELDEIGFNHTSNVHTDVMISDENTDVTAHTYDGKEIPLLVNGGWVI